MAPSSRPSPTAVDKALHVLRCVRELEEDATFTLIARRSGLAKATTHRMLAALERHGEVWRDPHDRYHVTRGADDEARATLVLTAVPHLLRLHSAVRQPSSLAVLDAADVVYLTTLCDEPGLALVRRTARRASAHRTMAGRLLLAFDDKAARHAYDRAGLSEADRRALRHEAVLARREHVLIGRPSDAEGVFAAAALVPATAHFPSAAVVAGGPEGRVAPEPLRRVVLGTALAVRRALSPP
ncbi:helix-turn-helix domain-containing protein [Streptomyces sp. RB110-1]|uniref:helix-turn-helix domain-containing protein n=1 Tax=unclassified Streptomyces TaxID=2593676 RepID=UPI00190240D8|nr:MULTISPECIES: helix-turn-helix domain-containing protein [unclassified Streptomyces]MBK0373081.1 helix-turn-helix domain-containing protein [Streptomyces sp. RB110-1]MBK0390551.1 helix-turn-helix domain-containing protein [Streptomyces sp. RB110-2]